jgi:anti-sigma factor RsiW
MNCHAASLAIDERLDGTLDAARGAALAAHLAGCAACRGELAALERLRGAARALPATPLPVADLWPAIAARTVVPRHRPLAWAAVAVVGLAGLLALRGVEQRPVVPAVVVAEVRPTGVERRAEFVAQVTRTTNTAAMAPATRAVVEQNMRVIQKALREIELAVERDPSDPNLRELLIAMHLQESALIERIQRLSVDANRRNDI